MIRWIMVLIVSGNPVTHRMTYRPLEGDAYNTPEECHRALHQPIHAAGVRTGDKVGCVPFTIPDNTSHKPVIAKKKRDAHVHKKHPR